MGFLRKRNKIFLVFFVFFFFATSVVIYPAQEAQAIAPLAFAPEAVVVAAALASAVGIHFLTEDAVYLGGIDILNRVSESVKNTILAAVSGTILLTEPVWSEILDILGVGFSSGTIEAVLGDGSQTFTLLKNQSVDLELNSQELRIDYELLASYYQSDSVPESFVRVDIADSQDYLEYHTRFVVERQYPKLYYTLKYYAWDGTSYQASTLKVLDVRLDGSNAISNVSTIVAVEDDGVQFQRVNTSGTVSNIYKYNFNSAQSGAVISQFSHTATSSKPSNVPYPSIFTVTGGALISGTLADGGNYFRDDDLWNAAVLGGAGALPQGATDLPTSAGGVVGRTGDEIFEEGATEAEQNLWQRIAALPAAIAAAIAAAFAGEGPAENTINYDRLLNLGHVFTTRFPFSLPWDFFRAIEEISVVPEQLPPLSFSFYHPTAPGKAVAYEFEWPDFVAQIASYTRPAFLIIFGISLIFATQKLFGGAK